MVRVLIVHNFYRQPGGEDAVFRAERDLLRSAGHDVRALTIHNREIETEGVATAVRSIWNREFVQRIRAELCEFGADVVHFHNTLPLVSPASIRVARAFGAATVVTLHNYRMMCPSGLLFRDNSVCEDCVGRLLPVAGIARGCYRGSRLGTAAVGLIHAVHRSIGTWRHHVDRFIALTDFARGKFIAAGLPAGKISVKPNFVAAAQDLGLRRSGVLFVGRLSPEKGIGTLLEAAREFDGTSLRIVGDGPLAGDVRRVAAELPWVHWLGARDRAGVDAELARAACLAFPSTWYEGMPMTVLEAFAASLPVVASDCGAVPELVRHGENGYLVPPGDAGALARTIGSLTARPASARALGARAREIHSARFAPGENLRRLEQVYAEAIGQRRARRAS